MTACDPEPFFTRFIDAQFLQIRKIRRQLPISIDEKKVLCTLSSIESVPEPVTISNQFEPKISERDSQASMLELSSIWMPWCAAEERYIAEEVSDVHLGEKTLMNESEVTRTQSLVQLANVAGIEVNLDDLDVIVEVKPE